MRVYLVLCVLLGTTLAKPSLSEIDDSKLLDDPKPMDHRHIEPSHTEPDQIENPNQMEKESSQMDGEAYDTECSCAENDEDMAAVMSYSQMTQLLVKEATDMLLTNPFTQGDSNGRFFCFDSRCKRDLHLRNRTCMRLKHEGPAMLVFVPQCFTIAFQYFAVCCRN